MSPATRVFANRYELGEEIGRGGMADVYLAHDSIESIPADVRARLEKEALGQSLDSVWAETVGFWSKRDPHELTRAEASPKHKMALCFRWYLGLSSRWAIVGDAGRKLDYQVWCGPAMGAFNRWVRGSFLEAPSGRSVVQIARNLLEGAAVVTRAHQLRTFGVAVPSSAFHFHPRRLS